MLKILVIEPTVFGHDGISNVVTNYYLYQDHDEVKMDLVTINPINEKLINQMRINGDKNYVIPYRNRNPLKYLYVLRRIIKQNGYQIVHVHGCSSIMAIELLAAKLAGVKVRIAHSHNTTCDHKTINKILRPLFLSLCTTGFACGQEAGEWMFGNRKFYVISNGIDIEKFSYNQNTRDALREKYNLDGKIVIGHVGRFSEQKNHKKLIEIFEEISKKYNNSKLVLIGEGELKKEIEAISKEKRLDVLFVGVTEEVEKWLQVMDLMVFPSLFEGLPLGIVEAQAAGLPCVLSNTISPMTAITDLVKFINIDESAKMWADHIMKTDIINRQEHQFEIENQIKKSHFDIRENCKYIKKLYLELIKNGVSI